MKIHIQPPRAQGSMEYTLLVGAAVLIAIIIISMLLQSSGSGSGILEGALNEYSDQTQDAAFGDEDDSSNPSDPVDPICFNGEIEPGEICDGDTISCMIGPYPGTQTCESDCSGYGACVSPFSCGDNVCNFGETSSTCLADCPAAAFCGNDACDAGEDVLTCASDCPANFSPKELWMHPHHYTTHGAPSWIDNESQWDTTVNSLDTFGVFWANVNGNPGPFSLPLMQEKNIRVSAEVGALREFQCDGTTFFHTQDEPVFDKLVAGGHSNFIASMDAPFTYTVKNGFWSQCYQLYTNFTTGDPDPSTFGCAPITMSCEYTIDQVADELIEYLALFHAKYPQADIGWIEPHPLLRFDTHGSSTPPIPSIPFPDFKEMVDVLTSKIAQYNATNPPTSPDISLQFYHADAYFLGQAVTQPFDTWGKQLALASYVRSKGMRFGILLNNYDVPGDDTQAKKNQSFHDGVLDYYDCWHQKGGTLDDVMVESWVGTYPSTMVPEETPYTFTNTMYGLIERMSDPAYNPSSYSPSCTWP